MKRSKFSLSHKRLLSFSQGELVPIGITEVLPGDTIQQSTSAFLRAAPLVTPVMHSVQARIEHFFVPFRLIWDSWEDFITGGPDGDDDSEPPYHTLSGTIGVGTLFDYLGVPTGVAFPAPIRVSALPLRAYALIFNEWYRDQDLVTPLVVSKADGADTTTNYTLQMRAWEKDYFTTARPWEQKGPAVTLPLGSTAPVLRSDNAAAWTMKVAGANTLATVAQTLQTGTGAALQNSPAAQFLSMDPGASGLYADLSSATAVDVNDVRRAFAIQRMLEARARYGSRYTEYLAYLGVQAADARLQRPEYLGGGRNAIQFSEVLQTAEGTNPVGTMKGHGVAAMRSNRYRRHFQEHGLVMSLMSVMPRTVYMDSLPRMFTRWTKDDYWQKELQHIGQQAVLNKEVYAYHATPDGTFGYQDRYDEYRRSESGVSGEFRTTLNSWHMARSFSSAPALNASFVQSNPTNRVYASTTTDQIYAEVNHKIVARRLVTSNASSNIF